MGWPPRGSRSDKKIDLRDQRGIGDPQNQRLDADPPRTPECQHWEVGDRCEHCDPSLKTAISRDPAL